MPQAERPVKAAADRMLRRALESLRGSRPALVPEYQLNLRARWGWGSPPLATVAERLSANAAGYEEAIKGACDLREWARGVPRLEAGGGEPVWENDYWGGVDALVQCAALRHRDPAVYVEIGSGFSTRFARRAIRDFGLRTRLVSIDPQPRAEVDQLCDEVLREPLENVELELFSALEPGDVVLLDCSHVALMNTDATVFFLEVLPRLPSGVLVGIDDIFLPWDYHPSWTGRMYGEQYLLAAQLLGGASGWLLRFPGWWIVECSPLTERFDALWPVVENRFGRHALSFWMERE
jgi:hypothetical protein